MSEYFEIASVNINNTTKAIKLLQKEKLQVQALILLYSLIDAISFLAMDSNKKTNTRTDFMNWVDNYIIPILGYDITSLDLYAARCGILHASIAESKLILEGNAAPIFYSWGNKSPLELQGIIDANKEIFHYKKKPVVISIEVFLSVVIRGWERYQKDLLADEKSNSKILKTIKKRSGLIFKNSVWE